LELNSSTALKPKDLRLNVNVPSAEIEKSSALGSADLASSHLLPLPSNNGTNVELFF
jgi:hypothetical protein